MERKTAEVSIRWKRALVPSTWARKMNSIAVRLIEVRGSTTGGGSGGFVQVKDLPIAIGNLSKFLAY